MAEFLEVKVKVPKEAYELEQGLVKFIAAIKTCLADGFQAGEDLPVLMSSALMDLVPAVQGVDKLGEEAKADLGAMVNVGGLLVGDLVKVFVEKK